MNVIPIANNRVQSGRAESSPTSRSRGMGWRRAWLVLGVTLVIPAPAQDYSTTNRDALGHFWAVAEQKQRPVTVVSFGDSMADSWLSPNYRFMNKLTERLGMAGFSLNNYRNALMFNLTNGATYADPDAIWFCRYLVLPPGGGIWWENQANAGGIYSDTLGHFFVSHPQGGPFTLSLSTNGGPWFAKLSLDGYSASSTGCYTNLTLSPNYYRIRVDGGGAGTNYILGVKQVMSQTNGVHVAFLDHWGISLGHVTNVPLAIREPIFSALQPDLLVWHMKEPMDLGSGTSNRMEECERWWTNSAPSCDILYVGTPWVALDTNSTTTLDQNAIVRNIALNHHRAYVDLMQPTFNYQWLFASGFMADETHLNSVGSLFCANLMWDDLGFFALGLNRKLSLNTAGPQLHLTYDTSAGAVYRLEVSTNLQNWSAVFTNPVGVATFATNFLPSAAHSYYRLGLAPN